MVYPQNHDPMKMVGDLISQIDKWSAIIDDWWVGYSFSMCVYTVVQMKLFRGRLTIPCQVQPKERGRSL